MKVQVNQNIDSYKDDFFKGLTFRQTAVSVIGVSVGAGIFLVLTRAAHLRNQIRVRAKSIPQPNARHAIELGKCL